MTGNVAGDCQNVSDDRRICDKEFMDDVKQLKVLRSYMIRQVKTKLGSMELDDLNTLRFDEAGRFPTAAEWKILVDESRGMYQNLSEEDRRRFLYGHVSNYVTSRATFLGYFGLISLLGAAAGVLFRPPSYFPAQN